MAGTLCTVAHQAPLFMGFSKQEYWNGLPCPLPGDRLNPGIEPTPLTCPALAGGFFTTSTTLKSQLKLLPFPYLSIVIELALEEDFLRSFPP